MQEFSQRLMAARKAQKLTQDQLAKMANVSRPTVSHWENGRALPDLDMLKTLNTILGCDLTARENAPEQPAEAESPAQPQPDAPAAEAAPQVQPAAPAPQPLIPMKWIALALVLAVLLGVGAGLWLHHQKAVQAARDAGKVEIPVGYPSLDFTLDYDLDWYLAPDVPQEGKAWVKIYTEANPIYAVANNVFNSGFGWYYTFHIAEQHGVDFEAESLTQTLFRGDKRIGETVMTKDQLISLWSSPTLYSTRSRSFSGGFPVQDITGVGLVLTGKDANGNAMTFHGYVELSPALQP